MNATETVARWIAKTSYADIPSAAVTAAKETYFDCLGLVLAGSAQPLGQIIQKYISEQGGPPEATVLASGLKTSVANAALANGAMGMALDYDPEPQMMALSSALLAVAEKVGASGRDLLEAFILGSELGWGLGNIAVADMERRGLHHQGVLGGIAVAAACAKLMKLDQRRIAMAMGMAGSMGGGLLQSEGSMTKPLLGGLIARDGVIAAQLVAMGMTAGERLLDDPSGFCGTSITEGVYDFTEMAENLGRPFRIQELKYVRQYPCCRANHGVLDSILSLMREEQFDFRDVERVELDQSYNSLVMRYDRPDNEHQARFSIRFNIAAALVDGKVGVDTFTPEKIQGQEIQETMSKVQITVRTQWEAGSGASQAGTPVKVHLKDGRVLTKSTAPDQILGSYKNPLGLDYLVGKFRENAALALPAAKVEQAVQMWSPLGEVGDIVQAVKPLLADGQ